MFELLREFYVWLDFGLFPFVLCFVFLLLGSIVVGIIGVADVDYGDTSHGLVKIFAAFCCLFFILTSFIQYKTLNGLKNTFSSNKDSFFLLGGHKVDEQLLPQYNKGIDIFLKEGVFSARSYIDSFNVTIDDRISNKEKSVLIAQFLPIKDRNVRLSLVKALSDPLITYQSLNSILIDIALKELNPSDSLVISNAMLDFKRLNAI